MNITDKSLLALISNAGNQFTAQYNAYLQELDSLESTARAELARITALITSLEAQLAKVAHPELHKKLIQLCAQTTAQGKGKPDFEKLVYYIQRLNLIEHPEYKLTKNKSYCNTLLKKIAVEYKILENALLEKHKKTSDKLSVDKQRLYDDYKARLESGKSKVDARTIELAKAESDRVINEIKASV